MKYNLFLVVYFLFSCNSDNNLTKSNKETSTIIDTEFVSISKTFLLNGKTYLKSDSSLVNGKVERKNENSYSIYNYKNGLLEGKSVRHLFNWNTIQESNWSKGKRNGKSIEKYQSGQLWIEENWVNGILEGNQYSWYENGQLWMEIEYENGRKKKQQEWYNNGQLTTIKIWDVSDNLISEKCWNEEGVEIKCWR